MNHVVEFASVIALTYAAVSPGFAQEAKPSERVARALSAGPPALAAAATVKEWGTDSVLRPGTNGYTCFPGFPNGTHPMCLDAHWLRFIQARLRGEPPPQVSTVAVGYWLQGAEPMSNDSPSGTTNMFDGSPHVALLVPKALMSGLPVSPVEGAPWIMWSGTAYAHVMVPVPKGR